MSSRFKGGNPSLSLFFDTFIVITLKPLTQQYEKGYDPHDGFAFNRRLQEQS